MTRKAIFIDRDDTLVEDPGYINDPGQLKLLPGAAKALVDLKNMGYMLVLVTNQSAIARGIITEEKLAEIHKKLKQMLASEGAYLDKIYYCPYHIEGAVERYRVDSEMRKPNPGMLLKAAEELDIDLENSWMVGDSPKDVQAGKRAGCRTILVDGNNLYRPVAEGDCQPDRRAVNLKEAVNIIKLEIKAAKQAYSSEQKIAVKEDEQNEEGEITETKETMKQARESEETEEQAAVKEDQGHNDQPENLDVDLEKEKEHSGTEALGNTEYLLNKILEQLKQLNREEMFEEFSALRLLAGAAQFLVFLCLLLPVLFLMAKEPDYNPVFTSLGFAVVFQVMALTLCLMNNKK